MYFHKCHATYFVGDSVGGIRPNEIILVGSNLPHTTQRKLHYYNENPDEKPEIIVIQFLPDFLGKDFFKAPELNSIQRLIIRSGRGLRFSGLKGETIGARLM
jgi:hypothetical protein